MENAELVSCELVDEKVVDTNDLQAPAEIVLADVSKPYVEKFCRVIPLGTQDGKSISLCTLRVVIPLTPDWVADLPYVPLQPQGYYAIVTLLVICDPLLREKFEPNIIRFFGTNKSLDNFEAILTHLKRLGVLSELWYIINGSTNQEALEKGILQLFEHLKFKNLNPHISEETILKELNSECTKACAVLTAIGRYLVHTNYPTKDEMHLVKDIVGEGREWRYTFSGPVAALKENFCYRVFN